MRLALAYAYLMQGLWVIFNQPIASEYTSIGKDIQQGFDKAEELFQVRKIKEEKILQNIKIFNLVKLYSNFHVASRHR